MINQHIDNKIVLVTGGTGSWGHELVSQLLQFKPGPKEIRIYSRGEHKQVHMRSEFTDKRIKFIIGDVRSKNVLNFAMENVDTVFHLAALKHVPVCEDNPWETVLTNIYGTQNVIETAIQNRVEAVVDISTDKAVDPFNLYGVTKACGEKLIINANKLPSKTKFVCVRGGNVIGTNGSVIPLFKHQILQRNEITVTNPLMTRYLMSTHQAIHLIFQAIRSSRGGEIYVLRMPATTVEIIAKSMIKIFGNEKTKMKIIGSRQGEKLHEVLVSKNEMPLTSQSSQKYFTIYPSFIKKSPKIAKSDLKEFTSKNACQLSQTELISILEKESWLFQNQTTII